MNTLAYLSNEAFSSIPPELIHDLQRMLSANESIRPSALDFTGNTWIISVSRPCHFLYVKQQKEKKNYFRMAELVLLMQVCLQSNILR